MKQVDLVHPMISLPVDFTTRPAQLSDLEMVAAMLNAYSRAVLGVEQFLARDMEMEWKLPEVNLEDDLCLVFAPDGSLAGYGELWDMVAPYVRKVLWARVHPDHWGKGIGSALVTWGERRARQQVNRAPAGSRVSLQNFISVPDAKAQHLLEGSGFVHIRSYWRMVKEFQGTQAAPSWPEGVTVRSLRPGEDETPVLQAAFEAFRDHWGSVPEPFESYRDRWLHILRHDTDYDPDLFFLAQEQGEVAGISFCFARSSADPSMGWVATLGVRRPWRKRGLGLALLEHSFVELQRRGSRRVGLGVDAQNITGATRLYEKAGMQPDLAWTNLAYEKELRSGVELSYRPDNS